MLSNKTRYAILAIIRLAREYGKGTVMIADIAKSEHIPQRFLEAILLEMKKIGWLGSKLGKAGGYYLLKSPSDITLLDIVRHFEGTIAMTYCVSEKAYKPCEFCVEESSCKTRNVFKEIRDNTFQILQNSSIQSLV